MRVIAIKGPPQAGPLAAHVYRAQAYEADPYGAPAWECEHDHTSPLEAHDCGKEWLQQNSVDETDLK